MAALRISRVLMTTQMTALSIRQPWAWLIVNGYKSIENRSWAARFRGRLLIHAGKAMTADEWFDAFGFARSIIPRIPFPHYSDFQRGGIVGEAELVDCVSESSDPWFAGPYGFVLKNQKALPFRPCRGALGFFQCSESPKS